MHVCMCVCVYIHIYKHIYIPALRCSEHFKAISTAGLKKLSAAFPSLYFKAISFSLSHYLSIQEKIANSLECKPQN